MQEINRLGDEGGKALGEALKDNTSVKELYLVSVFLLFLLVFVLRVSCCCGELGRLTCAVQTSNDIGAVGGKALGEALKDNTSIQILRLVSVFLVFLLVFVLRVSCCCEESGRLTYAVQENNRLGDEGGKALGEALKVNTSVKELYLVSVFLLFLLVFVLRVSCCCGELGRLTCAVQTCNRIGDSGVSSIASSIKGNTTLTFLNLVSSWFSLALLVHLRSFGLLFYGFTGVCACCVVINAESDMSTLVSAEFS